MKKYWFAFTADGRVRPGEIEGVIQAGLEEKVGGFNKQRMGCQLIFWRMVDGPIRPPQITDRYVQLFMSPKPFQAPLRLIDLYVKYYGVSFPYSDVRVVQYPANIFARTGVDKECNIPIYVTCQPKDGSVTISLQIIEATGLAECRNAFLTFQHQVEDLLVTSAATHSQLRSVLHS